MHQPDQEAKTSVNVAARNAAGRGAAGCLKRNACRTYSASENAKDCE
jgi:hypothetical protein